MGTAHALNHEIGGPGYQPKEGEQEHPLKTKGMFFFHLGLRVRFGVVVCCAHETPPGRIWR